jgi:hypothetical protein
MNICGQYFNKDVINCIQETIEQEPEISRGTLSRRVCEWLNWKAPNGRPCEVSCRKALLRLDRKRIIKLPEVQYSFPKGKTSKALEVSQVAEVDGNITKLGAVEIIQVPNCYSKLSRIWNNLMNRYHYLGSGPLCGAQIRYLVQTKSGWVGALSFSAASWALKDRDNFIGWSVPARIKNLQYIVCNSRFLIVPGVHVPNLASHILSKCIRCLGNDWQKRYNYRPVLLETFVDPEKFKGTCYRAANWIKIGRTSGRRLGGKKDIYLYPLGSIAKAKAAYRFFNNKRIDMDELLNSHIEMTAQRIKDHDIILAVQDTTILNYTTHLKTEGIGPINTTKDKAMGLILHDTMAFSSDGSPLGLVQMAALWDYLMPNVGLVI